MRFVIAAAALATVFFGAASAQAEKRIFIIANNADGYGVDRCLASGEKCGTRRHPEHPRRADFDPATGWAGRAEPASRRRRKDH